MKIQFSLFVFLLTLQALYAQFNYISPVPGSQYHNPQTSIILKNGHLIAKASVADRNLLTVVGSISGNHTWTARYRAHKFDWNPCRRVSGFIMIATAQPGKPC